MGKASRKRGRGTWLDGAPAAEGNPDLWIESAPRTAEGVRDGVPALCLGRWGALEWYAGTEDVIATARDLMTAATHADLVTELLGARIPGETVRKMLCDLTQRALGDRVPAWGGMLGLQSTIGVMPGGSQGRRAGVVLLKRANMIGTVTPEGARVMAGHWIEVAVASRQDELVGMALVDVLGSGDGSDRAGAMIAYMAAMRQLGAAELKDFRREEAVRLRLLFGEPPQ